MHKHENEFKQHVLHTLTILFTK